MKPSEFLNIYHELIDDNPLAVRAVLKVLKVDFTDEVPTLCVTCEERPVLRVNLEFVSDHCQTDAEVRAVIVHEFLHVLLRHTERFTPVTKAEHLALDAVINAVIHRTMGPDASRMMSRYYAEAFDPFRLLRPETSEEAQVNHLVRYRSIDASAKRRRLATAWQELYEGRLLADDIRDLADDLLTKRNVPVAFLGNHDAPDDSTHVEPEAVARARAQLDAAVDASLKAMNGSGIFRAPKERGLGATEYQAQFAGADEGVARWKRETYAVLKRYVMPDPRSARDASPIDAVLPVLSPRDRRAALRATWSPFLPNALWASERQAPVGSAHVYLDASGSMHAELPLVVALLAQLSGYIKRPFWAFSTVVSPARIEGGRLMTASTGGTSMRCVLEHLATHRPRAAVVVTDGFIEALSAADVARVRATRLHVLVTRDGTTAPFARVGLPYTQLGKVPQ